MEPTTTTGELLRVEGISKSFKVGSGRLRVLEQIDFAMGDGEILAVMGQSGSGKSTLLHQVGLLDKPDTGKIYYRGTEMPLVGNRAARARNVFFGFVFQFYHLMPEFTALENVLMPAMILHDWVGWRRQKNELMTRAKALLERVGLGDRMKHRPPQLSGGERQRVAIARALINEPPLLLCDEPTGNLDRRTAEGVKELLWDLNRTDHQGMIVVTHDPSLAAQADRTLALVDGRLTTSEES